MPIDQCRYSFDEIYRDLLPRYMAVVHAEMKSPYNLADFAIKGRGVKTLCAEIRRDTDFSGCYAMLDQGVPVYVGISRTLVQRLRQHVIGKSHYDASLAYRIAARNRPHGMTRSVAMLDADFVLAFDGAKRYLRGLQVVFVEIVNPVELYLFEVYAAMALDTSSWNSFETH